ncbi:MAG: diguanylate cyclase [Rubripirellula sp.]|nr:diguanylate cyclase [Rubripirellula sp.]
MTDPSALNDFSAESHSLPLGTHGTAESGGMVEEGDGRVGQLLAGLQKIAPNPESHSPSNETRFENQLALVRLGMATSLFYSLRTKHPPTAAHCLRVSLYCSTWAVRLGLDEMTRDRLEVAALLHDLGKIGIPDRILRKPGKLTVDEQLTMDCCPSLGCEILRGCTNDAELLDIIRYASTWFESRRHDESPRRDAIPLGSRMLAIVDAFDAMTTDSVYRPAMSRERAIQELVEGSGTQFDPELALEFHRMLEERPEMLQQVVIDRWLQQLKPGHVDGMWGSGLPSNDAQVSTRDQLFYQQLLGDLREGVIFTDGEGNITHWNGIMEQLTGIAADAILSQNWSNECVRLRQRDDEQPDACLVKDCLASGVTIARPMLIEQPDAEPTPVHVQVSPVVGVTRGIHGTVIVVRDLSEEAVLREQVASLHHQSTRDPLTQSANSAWFDQVIQEHVDIADEGGQRFSLITCDLDQFKKINESYGHAAGDEALKSIASILDSHSRDVDLLARYSGEEFLLLTPGCDNAMAARRAEVIRKALESSPLSSLAFASMTASFGVTEYQSGDTPHTIIARSKRAMMRAKNNGRNRVVQLGSGINSNQEPNESKKSWFSWLKSNQESQASEIEIISPVPVDVTIEKLRGFIADHDAEIINVRENHVSLKLNASCGPGGRRRVDQRIAMKAEMTLSELDIDPAKPLSCKRTNVHLQLRSVRNRDRRSAELNDCFRQVTASLNSYLMGQILTGESS